MLVRHGYGVLLFDRRGEGQSEGDFNAYGWGGDARPQGGASASCSAARRRTRAESAASASPSAARCCLQTAAENRRARAVVSEGAGRRSLREHLHIPGLGAVQKWITPWVAQTGALMVMSNSLDAAVPRDLVARIAPRPILLIYSLHGLDDESLNRVYYADAHQPKTLWEVPRGGHTGALQAVPVEYEARVVSFFDHALLTRQNQQPGGASR